MRAVMSRFSSDSASKRLEQLRRVLKTPLSIRTIRSSSSSSGDQEDVLSIGDQSITVKPAKYQELVPRLYVTEVMPQSTLRHLKWIMQKDLLGQDMFLIGPSGPLKRHLALMYCELTQKEVEYISLSRDTTEADLKQRREIINGTAHYVNQCAVKAATEGRVLIIEGIEKAERNVLPVLNNLLENREMALEDGRFLVSPLRYDKLLMEHGQKTLDDWRLTRVSGQFRVIALGLPVPPYHGNPLDPPLRSRFQSRNVAHLPFHEQLEFMKYFAPNISDELLSSILSVCSTLQTLSGTSQYGLMDFPMHQLKNTIKILNALPSTDVVKLLNTAFPAELLDKKEMLADAMKRFHLPNRQDASKSLSIHSITDAMSQNTSAVCVTFDDKGKQYSLTVPGWHKESGVKSSEFVSTSQNERLIAEMMQSHFVGDFCVVGEKGTGKTVLINEFARRLGYEIEPVMLYWDMTARDLCQQRVTLPNGDTSWRHTPLVDAALKGRVAVLDGVNRLDMGTLAVLQRLIHDREIVLFNGTKLLGRDHYSEAKRHAGLNDEQMAQRSIFPISDKFRIVCTAEPQSSKNSGQQYTNHWSNPEFVSMFLFHHMKSLSLAEEELVLLNKVTGLTPERIKPLLNFVHGLRQSSVPMVQSLASSLSTRQLLRIANRMVSNQEDNLYQAITKACLFRFLPQTVKATLLQSLGEARINPTANTVVGENKVTCEVNGDVLRIGNTTAQLKSRHNLEVLVPDVLFYENQQHLHIMEDMLKDYMLGEHLLLVGNQGVGKNKIVDHFLHLMNLPREYLQLHRDTTVQTLTLQPSVQDGQITYQDSPLVRAVKAGMVLMVDEADKAPTHVTCILKNLVENSEITLADGRRIVSHQSAVRHHNKESVIIRHPDFRMIVLANRPGFPFLGNDFFASIGDMFSCHAIDNPDLESEMAMLKQYGPNVPEDTLKRLVGAFGELRQMSDDGTIAYPYSTREVVNIVKHLERFPNEGVASVVRNVFDFDSYHSELLEVVMKTLHKHGIPVGATHKNIHLAQEQQLSPLKLTAEWSIKSHAPDHIKVTRAPMKSKGPYKIKSTICPLDRIEDRGNHFSERKSHWVLPIHETHHIESIGTGPGRHIHVSIRDPAVVYSMTATSDSMQCVDISDLFPYPTSIFSPKLNLVGLNHEFEGQLLLHDVNSNALLLLNPRQATITEIVTQSFFRSLAGKLTRKNSQEESRPFCICTELSSDNLVVLFQEGSSELLCVDVSNKVVYKMETSFPVKSLNALSNGQWIISSQDNDIHSYLLYKSSTSLPVPDTIVPIEGSGPLVISATSTDGLKPNDLGDALQQTVDENTPTSYSRMFTTSSHLAAVAVGLPFQPDNKVKCYSFDSHPNYADITKSKPIVLPTESQIIYPVLPQSVQKQVGATVVDLARHSLKEIKLKDLNDQYSGPHYKKNSVLHAARLGDDCVVVVDGQGLVQVLETGHFALHKSLKHWKKMVGDDSSRALQMTYQRDSLKDVSQPKHGKVDTSNDPHVGGNTWAGGTGGRDTAGLGGKGGPYRLDAGHDVYQVSDAEKEAVPNEVKKAAREMNRKAFKAKLKEIQMSEHDAQLYQQFMSKVKKQINAIQLILNNVQSKGLERQWIKHQTSGDLDDSKLIEGLTGERAIFKRRGEKHPEFGSPQLLPKHFRLVVDVSGSMYRFNGLDGRLERTLEATLMILEGFNNHHDKFKLDIVGHSGDTEDIPFVVSSAPPANDKERLDVLKTMHAHSQYCWPGDNTLPATKAAIKEITKEPADEYFVVVLSDANFNRYGINPDDFAKLLNSDPQVNTFAIFIGSLGDQAERLKQRLPAGRAFICMNAADLPHILQQIFTSSLL